MPSYSEQEIIEGCRKRDRTLQEHLYKVYYSMFLKVCARYAKDMQDAEQLLNDGFLKVFLNVHSYKNKGSFEGWMRRIMVNTCLDHLRSNYLKDSMIMHINALPPVEKGAVNNSGLENMEFKELLALIQSLPVMTRTVFNLYVFEGYNHKEIAKNLEISEKTSHWHVHQAREILQKKIKKNESQKVMYESKRI